MKTYDDCIIFLLAKAYQRAHGDFKRKLQSYGVTPIQHLILDKYTLGVNPYVSLNQRVRHLGKAYDVGSSRFPADYEGLFRDRMIEGIVSYIHTWRIDELEEERYLVEIMDEFIRILDVEIAY